jgi:hypothetical protein
VLTEHTFNICIVKVFDILKSSSNERVWIGNWLIHPQMNQLSDNTCVQLMVTGLQKDIVNLVHERQLSPSNHATKGAKRACTINAGLQVWIIGLEPILKDDLNV